MKLARLSREENKHYSSIDKSWNIIKKTLTDVLNEKLPSTPRVTRKECMTAEILQKMDQRWENEGKSESEYKTLNKEIKTEIKEAKER